MRKPLFFLTIGVVVAAALSFLLVGGPGRLSATTPGAFCGDVDGDGRVTLADLDIVASYMGQSVPPAPKQVDMNGNGSIEVTDLFFVAAQWNTSTACQTKPGVGLKSGAPIFVIPLSFVRLGNDAATRDTWTDAQITALINGVNDVWNVMSPNVPKPGAADPNIVFDWPQKAFHDIDDPQKVPGADGDVKDVGPLPAPWIPDDKDPLEVDVVCTNAHANKRAIAGKQKQFPIILIQHFIDINGSKTLTRGLTRIHDPVTNKGDCLLITIQAKDNPLVLAHELGHLLCLKDVPDDPIDNNLMEGTKDSANTSLTAAQVDAAQACVAEVEQNLQTPPPPKIPTPTITPTPECNLSFPWDVIGAGGGVPDGAVTVADIFEVAAHFGDVKPTPPSQCNPSFPWDVIGAGGGVPDGAVTVADIFEVAAHFGDVKGTP